MDAEGRNTVQPRLMTGKTGTLRYMAPEVARMDGYYGFPADVHSFAILLWQVVTNRVPYAKISSQELFEERVIVGNLRPSLKPVDSDILKGIISAGWSPNPDHRPTFAWIVKELQNIVLETQPASVCGLSLPSATSSKQLKRKKKRSSYSKQIVLQLMAFARRDRSPASDGYVKMLESLRSTTHNHATTTSQCNHYKKSSHLRQPSTASRPMANKASDCKNRATRTDIIPPTIVITMTPQRRRKLVEGR